VAGAVAALASNHHGVGLDLEAATSVEAAVWSRITTDDERAELAAIDPATAGFRGKLLFSAKESVFKAVYPATGVHLYFRDCRIRLDPPPDGEGDTRGRFTATLTRAELPEELRTRSLVGGYAVVAGVILTSLTWPVR
jgi:4'-phosphopantetheinyl transferase EntD